MSGLKAWLTNTEHNNGVLQDRDDGRVEDCGVRLRTEDIVALMDVASFSHARHQIVCELLLLVLFVHHAVHR